MISLSLLLSDFFLFFLDFLELSSLPPFFLSKMDDFWYGSYPGPLYCSSLLGFEDLNLSEPNPRVSLPSIALWPSLFLAEHLLSPALSYSEWLRGCLHHPRSGGISCEIVFKNTYYSNSKGKHNFGCKFIKRVRIHLDIVIAIETPFKSTRHTVYC